MDRVCPFCARNYKFEEAVQNYGLCLFCNKEIPSAIREARKLGMLDALEDDFNEEFDDEFDEEYDDDFDEEYDDSYDRDFDDKF